MNPLGLSSESSDPSTWGTGVKMAIHSLLTGAQNLRRLLKFVVSGGKLFHILTLVLKNCELD